MELKTKPTAFKKDLEQEGRYHYTYKVKNGEKIKQYGNNDVKKEFKIHHYGDGGTLYYRK